MTEKTRMVRGESGKAPSWCAISIVIVMLALVLMGCGSADNPDSVPTVGPATATPQPTPSLQMGQVLFAESIGPDGAAVDPAPQIPRSTTSIYAVVEVANVQPGSSFSAAWTMDGTAIPELDSQTSLEAGASKGQIAFHLNWDGAALWPVGTLGVTITADSGETVSGEVLIVST
ncbi:MAG TPA: hypothetical protein VEW66_06855 [Thermomicrobiales bacterium]|nr:hypothetical protein [Thermomicrobiales bacterium]